MRNAIIISMLLTTITPGGAAAAEIEDQLYRPPYGEYDPCLDERVVPGQQYVESYACSSYKLGIKLKNEQLKEMLRKSRASCNLVSLRKLNDSAGFMDCVIKRESAASRTRMNSEYLLSVRDIRDSRRNGIINDKEAFNEFDALSIR